MSGFTESLAALLSDQADYYDELLTLARSKNKIILLNDIAALRQLTAKENVIITKYRKSEKKRMALLQGLAESLRMRPDELTMDHILNAVKEPSEKEILAGLRARIHSTMEVLKAANERNKSSIEHSLEYIEYTMNVIRGALAGGTAYYPAIGEDIQCHNIFDARQ